MRIIRSPSSHWLIVLFICSITILGLAAGSLAHQTNTVSSSNVFSSPQVVHSASTSTSPFDFIVTVLMENNGYCDVMTTCGGSGTYMTSLAQSHSVVGQNGYTAVDHPSEPNYVALAGASTLGISGDGNCCGQLSAPNILDRIEASGRTWQAWAEDASGSGTCSFSPPRSADHFPFLEFSDIVNNSTRCKHFQSTTSSSDIGFLSSLNSTSPANFVWLTPNDNDNCHDTSIPTCDTYVSKLVPKILNSNLFKTQKAALFIVYDEGGGSYPSDWVYATWAGPVVKTGFVGTGSYSHYSYAKTLETVWGLAPLNQNDANARAMTEFFGPASPLPLSTSFTVSAGLVVNTPVVFTATTTGGTGPYTVAWDFGDGSVGSGPTATHIFATAQTFTVTETVTDSSTPTQTATSTQQVIVSTPTQFLASFTPNPAGPTYPRAPTTITFTATASGGASPYTFSWDLGDSTTGLGTPVQHTYTANGTYTIKLTTTDANHVSLASFQTITVGTAAALTVTVSCGSATAGKPVTCSATVAGGETSYGTVQWSAPGGTPASGSGNGFTTTYAAKGSDTVTAKVTDAAGTTKSGTASVTVTGQPIVVTVTCGTATAGKPVTCTASATGGTGPYTFTWSSNGSPATGTGSSYTTIFSAKGNQAVTATTEDANNLSQPGTATVNVAPQPIVVTVNCGTATVGKPVNCSGSVGGGTTPYGAISWSAPSGSPASGSGSSFSTTYSTKGSNTVTASVTDANGVTKSGTASITVTGQPIVADFTFSPTSPQSGQQVTFTANPSGGTGPNTLSWDFGDYTTGTGSPVMHTYIITTSTTFTVVLTARDANGATQTASHKVMVSTKPPPDFAITTTPASLTIQQGEYASSTITVNSENNFTGTISFTASVDIGLNISLAQSSTTVSPGAAASFTVTIGVLPDTNAGPYNATVTGSTTSLLHATILTVRAALKHQPKLTVPGPMSTSLGSTVEFTVNATDSDPSLSLVLMANNLPQGASFYPSTGLFTWTPSSSQTGTFDVTFTATDNGSPSMSRSQTVAITVAQATQPPQASPATQQPTQGTCLPCQLANIATGWLMFLGLLGGITTAMILIDLDTRTRVAVDGRMKHQKHG